MNTNFIEHLKNLKIYADWKNSGLSTLDIYLDFREKNKSPIPDESYNPYKISSEVINFEDYEDPPTNNDAKEQEYERDNLDKYYISIKDKIKRLLLQYNAPHPPKFDLNDFPFIVCYKYASLADFMKTNEKQVVEYVELMKHKRSSDFFEVMSNLQFEMREVESSIWSEIFTSLRAYLFFMELTENIKDRGRDLSFFYRKMKEEKLLKASMKTYENWLERNNFPISKTISLELSTSPQRRDLYNHIRKKYIPF